MVVDEIYHDLSKTVDLMHDNSQRVCLNIERHALVDHVYRRPIFFKIFNIIFNCFNFLLLHLLGLSDLQNSKVVHLILWDEYSSFSRQKDPKHKVQTQGLAVNCKKSTFLF